MINNITTNRQPVSRKKIEKQVFFGIGSRIRKIRAGLTQKEFADKLGVSQGTIYQYEKEIIIPGYEVQKKLAEFGGVTVEWLLRGDSSPPQIQEFSPEDGYVVSMNPLETALLVAVVTQVECVIIKLRLKIPPEQKARLIARVYDDCRSQQLQPKPYLVERALLLVD